MKIGTEKFKESVAKVVQGAGFNKFIPLTTMISIRCVTTEKGGVLWLTTTDMTNTLDVFIDGVAEPKDMEAVVAAETFFKLVGKLTSEEVEITVNDGTLILTANGTYKFPLISDEDGLVTFPRTETMISEKKEIPLNTIMSVYNSNEPALAKTLEQPYLTGYYFGKETVSTDATVITFNDKSISGEDEPLLISAQALYLLTLNNQEKINFVQEGNQLQFITDNIVVTTTMLDGIDEYPIEEIEKYLEETFPSKCKISKDLILDVLDRLELFIEPYDMNGAYFTFTEEGIVIHSKKEASTETIKYIESEKFSPFVCCVDIPALKEQIQAIPDNIITLSYGNGNAIRLDCGDVIQIISLLEDEELGA